MFNNCTVEYSTDKKIHTTKYHKQHMNITQNRLILEMTQDLPLSDFVHLLTNDIYG